MSIFINRSRPKLAATKSRFEKKKKKNQTVFSAVRGSVLVVAVYYVIVC